MLENYDKKTSRWLVRNHNQIVHSLEILSPKGCEYGRKHMVSLPSKMCILRFLRPTTSDSNELLKQCLLTEISLLKKPIERICSSIIDDMSIQEKLIYSRLEDRIYKLSNNNCGPPTITKNSNIAKKMLCYVMYLVSAQST